MLVETEVLYEVQKELAHSLAREERRLILREGIDGKFVGLFRCIYP